VTRTDNNSIDEYDRCVKEFDLVIMKILFDALFCRLSALTFAGATDSRARDVEVAPFAAGKLP
jgi:hypothetical protein